MGNDATRVALVLNKPTTAQLLRAALELLIPRGRGFENRRDRFEGVMFAGWRLGFMVIPGMVLVRWSIIDTFLEWKASEWEGLLWRCEFCRLLDGILLLR